jgi:hypothetical protein
MAHYDQKPLKEVSKRGHAPPDVGRYAASDHVRKPPDRAFGIIGIVRTGPARTG